MSEITRTNSLDPLKMIAQFGKHEWSNDDALKMYANNNPYLITSFCIKIFELSIYLCYHLK